MQNTETAFGLRFSAEARVYACVMYSKLRYLTWVSGFFFLGQVPHS